MIIEGLKNSSWKEYSVSNLLLLASFPEKLSVTVYSILTSFVSRHMRSAKAYFKVSKAYFKAAFSKLFLQGKKKKSYCIKLQNPRPPNSGSG